MQIIPLLSALSGSLYLLTMTVIGIRLLVLAKRNRTRPELLLGLSVLLGGTLGATLEVAAGQVFPVPSTGAGSMMMLAKLLGGCGIALYNLFIWRVFRPDSRWAAGLYAVLTGISALAFVGFFMSGSFSTGLLDARWFWVELVGRYASPIWLIAESFRYWAQMRRRVKLDLADPLVANRFLLWGVSAVFAIVMLTTSIAPQASPGDQEFALVNLVILACSGVAASIPYWLAFFPPAAYRRFIMTSAAG